MSRETPYNPPIKRKKRGSGRLFMIGLSTVLHGIAIVGILTFSSFSVPDFEPAFAISVAEVPLQTTDLPAIDEGNREAGAPSSQPEQPVEETVPQFTPEMEESQPEEARTDQPADPEPEPEKEEQNRPEPEQQTPVREERPQTRSESRPQPVEEQPEQQTVSPNNRQAERREPEPEPQVPTPQETAEELQQRSGTFSSSRNVGGTTQHRMIAGESDPGGGGGAGLYRSVLIGRIAQFWDPPFTRRGEVRDCLVEFTIYSPPLPDNAVNQIRTSRVTNLRLLNSSGDPQYDARALDAVRRVQNWPPLPDSYKKETLVVQCRFYLIGEGT